jgi:gamma-glutamylcyclotransferase (GGCT)/AIG2-like uncharacterized protein YtfP
MFEELGLAEALDYVGEGSFSGELHDLGDYPGAVPGKHRVHGELYRIRRPDILGPLDRYEEFDPADSARSLFVRRRILVPPFGDAWAYFYNGPLDAARRIPSGDWRKRRSAA